MKLKSYRQLSAEQKVAADLQPLPVGIALDDEIFIIDDGHVEFLDTQARTQRYAGDWGYYCRICRVAFPEGAEHKSCNGQYLYVVKSEEQGRRLETMPTLRALWEEEQAT